MKAARGVSPSDMSSFIRLKWESQSILSEEQRNVGKGSCFRDKGD